MVGVQLQHPREVGDGLVQRAQAVPRRAALVRGIHVRRLGVQHPRVVGHRRLVQACAAAAESGNAHCHSAAERQGARAAAKPLKIIDQHSAPAHPF